MCQFQQNFVKDILNERGFIIVWWRGDDSQIVKAHGRLYSSQEPHDQFPSNGTQSILGVKGIQVCSIEGLHNYFLLANFSQTWNKAFLGNGDFSKWKYPVIAI